MAKDSKTTLQNTIYRKVCLHEEKREERKDWKEERGGKRDSKWGEKNLWKTFVKEGFNAR